MLYVKTLKYVFHVIFHPFDGFWDLKHEKRGSIRSGFLILLVTILAFFYQAIGKGYMFNPRATYSTVFLQVIAVIVPVLLWVVGNWCLTTLFDGEGSMKDIFIATCYSAELTLAQMATIIVTATLASIGTAGVSGAGMIMLAMVLQSVGLPVEGIALVAGVDRIFDMGRTVVNITGDSACAIVVSAMEDKKSKK